MKELHILFKISTIIISLILLKMLVQTGFSLKGEWLYITSAQLVYGFLSVWVLYRTWNLKKLRKELTEVEKKLYPDINHKVSFGYMDIFLALFSSLIVLSLCVVLFFKLVGDDFYISRSIGVLTILDYLVLFSIQSTYCWVFQISPQYVADYIEELE